MVFFQTSGAGSTLQFVFLAAIGAGMAGMALWKAWQQARRDPQAFDSFPLILGAASAVALLVGFPALGWNMATGRFYEAEVLADGRVALRYAITGDVVLGPAEIADIRPEMGHKNGVAAVFIRAGDEKRFYGRRIRSQRFDVDRADLLRVVGERQAAAHRAAAPPPG